MWRRSLILFLLLAVSMTGAADACSAFLAKLGREWVVGKSYDWTDSQGYLIFNPAGIAKKVFRAAQNPSSQPATWTSKYSSITFNQHAIDHPIGGRNTEGLGIELLVHNTDYPDLSTSADPVINSVQLAQFILDRFQSIDEFKKFLSRTPLKVEGIPGAPGLHYFLTDAAGHSAVIEIIRGTIQVRDSDQAPYVSNQTYDPISTWNMNSNWPAQTSVPDQAFKILDQRRMGPPLAVGGQPFFFQTQWQIVYEPNGIHWKKSGDGRQYFFDRKSWPTASAPLFVNLHRVVSEAIGQADFKSLDAAAHLQLMKLGENSVDTSPLQLGLSRYYLNVYGGPQ